MRSKDLFTKDMENDDCILENEDNQLPGAEVCRVNYVHLNFNNESSNTIEFERISLPFVTLDLKSRRTSKTHIALEVSNTSQIILCDTSAALTIMSEQIINQLPSKKMACLLNPIILIPFNSNESPALQSLRNTIVNQVVLLPIKIAGNQTDFPFYVCPGLLLNTLLGNDFLNCFRSIINMPKQKIEFEVPKGANKEEIQQFFSTQVQNLVKE